MSVQDFVTWNESLKVFEIRDWNEVAYLSIYMTPHRIGVLWSSVKGEHHALKYAFVGENLTFAFSTLPPDIHTFAVHSSKLVEEDGWGWTIKVSRIRSETDWHLKTFRALHPEQYIDLPDDFMEVVNRKDKS
jgi:hypothetical protein